MAKVPYDAVVNELTNRKKSITCSEMFDLLTSLKFKVVEGKNGNHRKYSHPEMPHFFGSNYDCGHKPQLPMKMPYVQSVLQVLKKYEEELKALEA